MKRTIATLSFIFLVIGALGVEISAQKIVQKAYINSGRCGKAVRSKSAVCRVTCAQRDNLQAQINELKNKPADQRTWADTKEIARLDALIKGLEKRIDEEVARLDGRIDGINTALERFIAASGERFERVETRVGDLEGKCYAIADGKKLRNSCTGQKISTGMGKGWKILTIANTALGVAGLFLPLGGGGNSNTAGVPPRATTGPSFIPRGGTGGSFVPRVISDL